MNTRSLRAGRYLAVILFCAGFANFAGAQAGDCPQAPTNDGGIVKFDAQALAGSGVLVRSKAGTTGGPAEKHGTTFVVSKQDPYGKALWVTDCDVFLKEQQKIDGAACPSLNVIKGRDRMRIGSAGINAYKLSLWRPNKSDPISMRDYDLLVEGVALMPRKQGPDKANWLEATVGNITYYVMLGDTRLISKKDAKFYIVEIFSSSYDDCDKFRPEKVVKERCNDCKHWPGPQGVELRLGAKPGSYDPFPMEADVGGGYEPPRKQY